MIDEGDCGAIGGMKSGRGNRSTRRKPAPAPFCSPQIPLDQTRAQTRAAAVGSLSMLHGRHLGISERPKCFKNYSIFSATLALPPLKFRLGGKTKSIIIQFPSNSFHKIRLLVLFLKDQTFGSGLKILDV
jgi:hypothetical protein